MEIININKLKRNPDKIKAALEIKGDCTICKKNLKILFPERYVKKGLAVLSTESQVIGIYAIVDDDNNYATVNISAMQSFKPYDSSLVNIEGETYVKFEFLAGDIFILNNNIVQSADNIFTIYNNFYQGGKIPFYLNYEDVSNILVNSKLFNGNDLGANPLIYEVITSVIARDPNNTKYYYKDLINNEEDINKIRPKFIGLSDRTRSLGDTAAKIIGAYLKDGLVNSIVEDEERSSDVSELLRR